MPGYSGTPLPKKLGLKVGQSALLIGVPKDVTEISEFQGFSHVRKSLRGLSARQFDYVHMFVSKKTRLVELIPQVELILLPDGILWVSWPKKSSRVASDIVEGTLREVVLPYGLVDVKVCAVNEIWSGLKFMFRKEIRPTLLT